MPESLARVYSNTPATSGYMTKRSRSNPLPRSLPNDPAPPSSSRVAAGAAVIALVTFVAYLPCLTGGFVVDDNVLVADSPLVQDPAGV
jgi:hypothetical protein